MCNANKCANKLMSTTTNSHATLLKAQQKQTGNAKKKTRIANKRATQTNVHANKCPTQRKQTRNENPWA